MTQETKDPLPSHHQAEGGDLREEGKWKQVTTCGDSQIPSQPASSSLVPEYNGYEALELDGITT